MTDRPVRPLIARDTELEAITDLLVRARRGESGAMAVIGPPGSGKSALLGHAEQAATAGSRPFAILWARGVESEAEVAFGGLLELLRPLSALFQRLPEPQAAALEGALALGPASGADRFTIAVATLAVLGAAAADRPLLVLVDDLHWLDEPSAQAILFVARRLYKEGVAIVVSVRPDSAEAGHLTGIPPVELGPLDLAASAGLARDVAGREFDDDEVQALYLATDGNPLAIVEACRGLGAERPTILESIMVPLPVADRIRVGLERRLLAFGPEERRATLIAAAAGTRAPATLVGAALAADGLSLDALGDAERAGIVRIRTGTIEFEHPLIRSAVYNAADTSEQRHAHRAIAGAAPPGSAERAWHLATAAIGPDDAAAEALEGVATDALARGAPSTALRAFERAAVLSSTADAAARRLISAGGAARLAGSTERALAAAAAARSRSSDPLLRADALALVFEIDAWKAPVATARSILADSERVAQVDRARSARMLAEAATALLRSGSIDEGVRFAERARETMRDLGQWDDSVEFALVFARIMDARATEIIDDVRALGQRLLVAPPGAQNLALLQQVALVLTWIEEFEASSQLLEHAVAIGRTQAPGALPLALAGRAELGYRVGRWHNALADADEAISLGAAFEQEHAKGLALACQSRLEACMGSAECRSTAAEAAEFGHRLGGEGSPISAWGAPALGLLELGHGQPAQAVTHFEKVVTTFRHGGIREPGVVLAAGALVECLARVGREVDARALLADLEASASATKRLGALAVAARCRGILAPEGDFATPFHEALSLHERAALPFEHAWTELRFGERLRRSRRRADARRHLHRALEIFERLGAEPWAQAASRELEISGETPGRRSLARSDALTPQELQVALMVAAGVTNREAGARLFLSAKTVDAHLGRIYRKLGIRSRTELANVVSRGELGGTPS